MDWTPLSSSNLAACRYDAETRLLQIRFQSGKSYSYQDVPQNVADGLTDAPSPGQYFSSNIKNIFSEG
jgi:KTSC domain